MYRYTIEWEHVLLIIIVAVGLAARLHDVHYNLDGDEIFSVELASKPFPEVISWSLNQDRAHPPLHNFLLHLWIKVFGASEASVRAMSIVFSAAFLLISFGLLRRLVSRWLALGLVAIFALSPLFVHYGQQARPYSLIAFLSAANLVAFVKVLDEPCERKFLLMWAISCTTLLYAQYLGILLIAFEIGLALLSLRSERLAILAYGAGGSLLILPWFIVAMGPAISTGIDPLPHISWMGPPTPSDLVWFYVSIFGDSPWVRARWLLLMLAFLGLAYMRNQVSSRSLSISHALLILIGIGLPTIAYLVSVWGPKPVFASRHLLGAAIAFVAAIGLFISTLPRPFAALLLLALLMWSIAALPEAFPHNTKPPWRDMASQIDKAYGSIAVFTQEDWVRNPLKYYRKVGSVRSLTALVENEKDHEFLFLCRSQRCSEIETKALSSRRIPLMTWEWGSNGGPAVVNQLVLYRIEGVDKAPSI